jgi:hypothetical protein
MTVELADVRVILYLAHDIPVIASVTTPFWAESVPVSEYTRGVEGADEAVYVADTDPDDPDAGHEPEY